MLARAVPERPCSVLLEREAWQALSCAIHHCPPPAEPPTLGEAVRWVAQCGGLVGRRRDQPGAETLWRGLQPLSALTRRYCLMRPAPPETKRCVHL
jgi:Transposase Tn5 dimerisation domain